MNYGVCPYDHRVFTAASERNTVKELPAEPKPFLYPHPGVKFGNALSLPPSDHPHRSRGGKSGGGGKYRRLGLTSANASNPSPGPDYGKGASKRRQRPIKVRGRVGRGGRIILDRVIFEPERGVKAASYPASVEMGGVYTAGLPLEAAERVVSEGFDHGYLGSVKDLGLGPGRSLTERTLIEPLAPMVNLSEGTIGGDGRMVYWPSLKRRRMIASTRCGEDVSEAPMSADSHAFWRVSSKDERLRRLPAYAPRNMPLVQDAD
jgi:hypothetical protein